MTTHHDSRVVNGKVLGRYPILNSMVASASMYMIEFQGKSAVAKVFAREQDLAFRNELNVLSMRDQLEVVPEVYEAREGVLILEYLEGFDVASSYFGFLGMLPLDIVRQVAMFMQALHERGYSLLDLNLGNVLVNSEGRAYFVDFEHLYAYGDQRPDFLGSPFAVGQAYFDAAGEEYQDGVEFPNYRRDWFPRCGVNLRELIEGHDRYLLLKQRRHLAKTALQRALKTVRRSPSRTY